MSGFEVRIQGDARVVVSGEVDMATAPELGEAMRSVASTGVLRLVVDLADVSFMDSSGLGMLAAMHREQSARGGVVVIASASNSVMAVLQVSGLDKLLVMDETPAVVD